ncbi:hypothetical protein CO172_03665 [Candidatus Uhrbacteria bacterium CG_4_9_14_3_um_filter_36_7]|uniref:DUF3179 domain-containing protein n=1 Tax=Candidatus Uhrbacteria bacterium CG_4_9_14_3_um_filter_36_7 TaxID=1975033 RepID=A0A2M7XFS3_9BACT|nr:MAG: hypothetical protein CO172_03665 [Candidatus Uhrbacteria bacterium CG_4_9_14_3_um_filter_36_7]
MKWIFRFILGTIIFATIGYTYWLFCIPLLQTPLASQDQLLERKNIQDQRFVSLDQPIFDSVFEADAFFDNDEPGIIISSSNISRFYPLMILRVHKIINDDFMNEPLAITYNPLSHTTLVFKRPLSQSSDPFLFHPYSISNHNQLYFYDQQTQSVWSQIEARVIQGILSSQTLELYPSELMTWKQFKAHHPNGQVLSYHTGFEYDYTQNPYREYISNNDIYFPLTNFDNRLFPKALIYGVNINGKTKAYTLEIIQKQKTIEETFENEQILISFDEEKQTVTSNQVLIPSFWFVWVDVYPQTLVYD